MANLTRKQQSRYNALVRSIAKYKSMNLSILVEDLEQEKAVLDAVIARTQPSHNYRDPHDAHVKLWGAQMVTRVNMMSGKEYQERRDTPGYLSPSRESYWSM